jgi:glycosyltransferase involved in cell wall biosynthesis
MPVYNGARYLPESLESILAQTWTDFEVVVVDDCSSDDSLAIARRFAERDPRVRVFRNEQNQKLVGNWNRCLELAQGEWIKYCFQDDLLEPRCLERMVQAACELGTPIITCKRRFLIEPNSSNEQSTFFEEYGAAIKVFCAENFLKGRAASKSGAVHVEPAQICSLITNAVRTLQHYDGVGTNFIGEPTAVMIKKSVLGEAGTFDPNLIQLCDVEYWYRIAARHGLAFVPDEMVSFRVHSEAATAANRKQGFFRKGLIDPLLMLAALAYSDRHAAYRDWLKGSAQPAFLDRFIRDFAYEVWRKVQAPELSAEDAAARRKTWEFACAAYPQLDPLKERNFLQRLVSKFQRAARRRGFHVRWGGSTFFVGSRFGRISDQNPGVAKS